jgi:peptidoglycan L-alanyl-D-glutamate endopeptidase CwlK
VTATLPKPPAEVPVIRSLIGLAPKFRLAVDRTLAAMHRDGFDPVVAETLRTEDRQAFLYGFGRDYDDGRGIVTNSRTAAQTWHGYGLAADIISATRRWNAAADFWQALGIHARANGLEWGGDWASFPDRPHVQWGKCRRSPSPKAESLYRDGGFPAVWQEVGAA